jgi:hypothetical protein
VPDSVTTCGKYRQPITLFATLKITKVNTEGNHGMIRARTARLLVWLLALVPVMLLLPGFGASDFASPAALLNALGRLTGVAGLALLLLAAALSARVPGFDQPFGGLTRLWHTHHLLGASSLILLLLHPILLAMAASDLRHRRRVRHPVSAAVGYRHLVGLAGAGPDDDLPGAKLPFLRPPGLRALEVRAPPGRAGRRFWPWFTPSLLAHHAGLGSTWSCGRPSPLWPWARGLAFRVSHAV